MIDRPSWDDWFYALAILISQKSFDPSTKHGCVVVSDDRTVLSLGYNSPPRGCDDSAIPLGRPEKYPYFIHSEANAIANAARSGVSLKGSTFYVTGHPCERCFGEIVNAGAKEIKYGCVSSAMVSEKSIEAISRMNPGIKMTRMNDENIQELFDKAKSYFDFKRGGQ